MEAVKQVQNGAKYKIGDLVVHPYYDSIWRVVSSQLDSQNKKWHYGLVLHDRNGDKNAHDTFSSFQINLKKVRNGGFDSLTSDNLLRGMRGGKTVEQVVYKIPKDGGRVSRATNAEIRALENLHYKDALGMLTVGRTLHGKDFYFSVNKEWLPEYAKNPTSREVAKCKKVLREADSNDLSYIQHIPISAGFDWEKNPTNAGGFPVAIMRLVNEIKESQHGKPEDQLTDFQASYLVPAYRHVFENDRGYIKLTPLGKKLHIVDGELKVRNGETETVKNAGSQYHNIDNFGGGKYVGYANGVWNIRKSGKTWIAERKDDFKRVSGATLKEISERLEKLKNGAAVANSIIDKASGRKRYAVTFQHGRNGTVKSLYVWADSESHAKKIIKAENAGLTIIIRSVTQGEVKNETASDFKRFTKDRLIELSKMFQGEASGARNRALSPDMLPQETWRLGYLVQMKIRHDGKVNTINFDGESYLAGDLRCNLWAVGKDARIEGIRKPSEGQLKKLGKLIQVDYVTAKKHIEGGKVVRFWHPLGEVNKDYPTLYIDHDGFPIILGGGYDIWNVGIVN